MLKCEVYSRTDRIWLVKLFISYVRLCSEESMFDIYRFILFIGTRLPMFSRDGTSSSELLMSDSLGIKSCSAGSLSRTVDVNIAIYYWTFLYSLSVIYSLVSKSSSLSARARLSFCVNPLIIESKLFSWTDAKWMAVYASSKSVFRVTYSDREVSAPPPVELGSYSYRAVTFICND